MLPPFLKYFLVGVGFEDGVAGGDYLPLGEDASFGVISVGVGDRGSLTTADYGDGFEGVFGGGEIGLVQRIDIGVVGIVGICLGDIVIDVGELVAFVVVGVVVGVVGYTAGRFGIIVFDEFDELSGAVVEIFFGRAVVGVVVLEGAIQERVCVEEEIFVDGEGTAVEDLQRVGAVGICIDHFIAGIGLGDEGKESFVAVEGQVVCSGAVAIVGGLDVFGIGFWQAKVIGEWVGDVFVTVGEEEYDCAGSQ